MRHFVVSFTILFALTACTMRHSTLLMQQGLNSNPAPSAECPNGLTGTLTLANSSPSSLVTNQSIDFLVTASGCQYGYVLYAPGSSTPLRFDSSTKFSLTYNSPQTNIKVSASVAALGSNGQPVQQITLLSAPFSVTASQQPLICTVSPSTSSFNIPVNASSQPVLAAPPALNVTVNSTSAAKVVSVTSPVPDSYQLAQTTPVPSTSSSASIQLMLSMLKLVGGSYGFVVQADNGNSATCATTVAFNFVPVQQGQPLPQFLFKGDVNADGIDDIVTWDSVSASFWVAVGSPDGQFTYSNFGTLAGVNLSDAFLSDFNKDGKADILFRVQTSGLWKMGFSKGNAFQFADLGTWPAQPVISNLALSDVNKDGQMDVVGTSNGVAYVSYLTISGMAGSIAAPIPQPPILNLNADPLSVSYGGSSTLSWTTSNTASCKLKQASNYVGLPGGTNVNGSYMANNLQSNTTFTLECLPAGGGSTATTANVQVAVAAPPPPDMTLLVKTAATDGSPDATIVAANSRVYVRWSVKNVSSCKMLQGGVTLSTLSSSNYMLSNAVGANTTFKLSCTALGGTLKESDPHVVQVRAGMTFNPSDTIDFGTVYFGQQSNSQKVVFKTSTNTSDATNVRVSLPDGFVFAGGTCGPYADGFNLASGSSCDYLIQFSPTQLATESKRSYNAPLNVTYNDGSTDVSTTAVTLKGSASVSKSSGGK